MLAAVATRLGAPWDGPGDPAALASVVEVPGDPPPWEVLDATREALVATDAAARRQLGAHHTPPSLARRLAAIALDACGPGPDALVVDPACGGGAFLVAAAELLVERGADPVHVVRHQLAGADVDPLAVATTRAALALWAGDAAAIAADVVAADGLTAWRTPGSVDVVVGNPPFRSPLASGARRGDLGAYTDLAGRFLVAALDLARPGGSVLLLQPESVLTARDAAPVRAAVADRGLAGLWVAEEPAFGASVRACALLSRPGARRVRRWRGLDVRPAGSTALDRAAPTWAHLRPGAPAGSATPPDAGTVADLATAAAGFRDQFYAIAAATTDGGPGHLVVTSGLIDPGRLVWGERAARIGKRRFDRPTVDPDDLPEPIRGWVRARLAPKVLVATQTKVVEAAPDPDGMAVPLTPVVAVHPRDDGDTWRIAAALTSPSATAWALRHFAGAGLRSDVVKLSAAQVLAVPLPTDRHAWDAAAAALAAGDVDACAAALAHGDDDLLAWWQARLPSPRAAGTV